MSVVPSTAIVPNPDAAVPTEVFVVVRFEDVYPEVKKHLSIIGKRQTNKQGDNIFSLITLSSAEDPIFIHYIAQGTQNVIAAIRQFVSEYYSYNDGFQFKVTNTRWRDVSTPDFVKVFVPSFKTYLVMYTVAEYLSMNFPELAQKYFDAALQALQAIIRLIFFKAPPRSSDVVTRLSYGTVPIEQSAYEFRVPLLNLASITGNFDYVKISLIRDEYEASSSTVVMKYPVEGGFEELSLTGNPFTGHITLYGTAHNYFVNNRELIGDTVYFKPNTPTEIHADDILVIEPTTSS